MPFAVITSNLNRVTPTGVYVAATQRRLRRRGSVQVMWPVALGVHEIPSLTATYDAALARVRLVAQSLPVGGRTEILRFIPGVATGQPVRGGSPDPLVDPLRVDDYEFTDGVINTYQMKVYDAGDALVYTVTATVTPVLTGVWLKNITRPYLNRIVRVHQYSDIDRPARGGILEVLGRRDPVAITDVRGSRRFDLVLRADTADEVEALELALSFGDTVYLQPPAGSPVPGPLHAFVGDVNISKGGEHQLELRFLTLPLTEVEAPDETILGSTITWAGVTGAYATWAEVAAAKATWLALMESISEPADEVVG